MNAPGDTKQLSPATSTTTTVFTSGNSQAVRLPKEFRLHSKTVTIFRQGKDIVLRETPQSFGKTLGELLADLPPLSAKDAAAFDAAMTGIRDTRPPQERDFSWADDKTLSPKKAAPRRRKV